MLGVEAHIAIAHVAVGGGDVGLFIVGHRLLSGDIEREDEVEEQHPSHQECRIFFDPFHRVLVVGERLFFFGSREDDDIKVSAFARSIHVDMLDRGVGIERV